MENFENIERRKARKKIGGGERRKIKRERKKQNKRERGRIERKRQVGYS